jgi:putative SbcD/Mre11-related phosphoesterase
MNVSRPREAGSRSKARLAGLACWQFLPQGAAVHAGSRTAVIADVHLGYEWARGAAGDCVPAHSLEETVERLESVVAVGEIERLVVAGDLVESPRPCHRTTRDVFRLTRWLADRGVHLVLTLGNHDRGLAGAVARTAGIACAPAPVLTQSLSIDGWTIAHGHRSVLAGRLVLGHHHPVLRLKGHTSPCFLVSHERIFLPAFSRNAAGFDVTRARLPDTGNVDGLHCLACAGDELLDFGPLASLIAALG